VYEYGASVRNAIATLLSFMIVRYVNTIQAAHSANGKESLIGIPGSYLSIKLMKQNTKSSVVDAPLKRFPLIWRMAIAGNVIGIY